MPLSEEELRLLEQMERALVADDPKLASTMRGTSFRAPARRRAYSPRASSCVGVVVLMTGAVTQTTRRHRRLRGDARLGLRRAEVLARPEPRPTAVESRGAHAPFSVIEGGRSRRKKSPRGTSGRSSVAPSMMERFEERWRRRRDQNGL